MGNQVRTARYPDNKRPMAAPTGKQYIVIRVPKPVDEADFFARVFDAAAMVVDEETRQLDTGKFVLRICKSKSEKDRTRNVHIEVAVDNVNRFTEEVWNRGIKYAARPQNAADGFRRVAFVSPADIKLEGIGPLKLDSTGAFPAFKDKKKP
jgi:hypothetical protein